VIHVAGTIASGRSGFDPVNGPVAGSDTLIEYIGRREGPIRYAAIVWRVDPASGSRTPCGASSSSRRPNGPTARSSRPCRISPSLRLLHRDAGAGDRGPASTLTGSIGIFAGRSSPGGVLREAGRAHRRHEHRKHAEMTRPARRFNPEELKKLQEAAAGPSTTVRREVPTRATARRRRSTRCGRAGLDGAPGAAECLVDELGGLVAPWPSPSNGRRFRRQRRRAVVYHARRASTNC